MVLPASVTALQCCGVRDQRATEAVWGQYSSRFSERPRLKKLKGQSDKNRAFEIGLCPHTHVHILHTHTHVYTYRCTINRHIFEIRGRDAIE